MMQLPLARLTSLGNAIRAYDIDSASIETARKAAVEALMTRGCPQSRLPELCEQWIVHGDFILDDVPAADFIVGNPPYVRAVEIDRTKRSLYVKRLSSVTTGCDLYVSFFDRGLDTLKVGGTLCFICADRWLQNKYGTLLRSRMGTDCDLRVSYACTALMPSMMRSMPIRRSRRFASEWRPII